MSDAIQINITPAAPTEVTVNVSQTAQEAVAVEVSAGRDAYQLALAEGYTGTRDEWLASLEGGQGPQGIQGLPGTGKQWVNITVADYEALTLAEKTDPNKVYNLTDFVW